MSTLNTLTTKQIATFMNYVRRGRDIIAEDFGYTHPYEWWFDDFFSNISQPHEDRLKDIIRTLKEEKLIEVIQVPYQNIKGEVMLVNFHELTKDGYDFIMLNKL